MSIPRYASTPASPSIQQMPELAATTPASPLPTTAVDILNAPLISQPGRSGPRPSTLFLYSAALCPTHIGGHFKPSGTLRLGGIRPKRPSTNRAGGAVASSGSKRRPNDD